MPLPRFDRLPEDRQEAILSAAAAEVTEHGVDGASLNRVLDRAGVSKGAMYYYFADRDDLLATTVRVHLERLLAVMGWPDPVDDPKAYWADWRARYERMFAALGDDPRLMAVMRLVVRARAGGGQVPVAEFTSMVDAWLDRMLAVGQAVGAVRDDLPPGLLRQTAFGLLEGQDRWVDQHWERLSETERTRLPSVLVGLLRGLVAPVDADPQTASGRVKEATP